MLKNRNQIKQPFSDNVFDVINYILLTLILMIFVYPLIFVASASISDPGLVWQGKVWLLPKGISFEGYEKILLYKEIWSGYRNTVIYTLLGTIINVVLTVMAAYPLSRPDFMARKLLIRMYTATMFFGGGLIPTYLLVKQMGMLNSMWALMIPNAVSVWNLVIARTYFQNNIPKELNEAAAIDGCNNFKFLTAIVIPLSASVIAVLTLFYGVGHWNSFFNALIYITSRELYPLQLVIREILVLSQMQQELIGDAETIAAQQKVSETIKYGVIIISSLPVLVVYPFVQKHFVKGVMIGSVKG